MVRVDVEREETNLTTLLTALLVTLTRVPAPCDHAPGWRPGECDRCAYRVDVAELFTNLALAVSLGAEFPTVAHDGRTFWIGREPAVTS